MKVFLSFLYKEALHIVRDVRTLALLLGLPIVLVGLFGFAITTEVRDVRLVIVDAYASHDAQKIVNRLEANPSIRVVSYVASITEADPLLRSGRVDMAVIFGAEFDEAQARHQVPAISIQTDGIDPNTSSLMTNMVQRVVYDAVTEGSIQRPPPFAIIPSVQLLFNPSMQASYYFVPGVMGLVLMLVCALMTSVSIVREKEEGTMELLLVSPVRPWLVIIAKTMPYFVVGLINLICILLMSVFLLDVPIRGSIFSVGLISLLFILVSLLLGLLISSFTESQGIASMICGAALQLPVAILSGMLFPIESMPRVLQYVSHVVPAKWFIEGMKKVMIQGLDLSYILTELWVLCTMIVLLMLVNIKTYKVRLD